jgi:hypothetical protein
MLNEVPFDRRRLEVSTAPLEPSSPGFVRGMPHRSDPL